MAALAAEAFGALALLAPNVFGTSELLPTIDAAWGSLAVGTSSQHPHRLCDGPHDVRGAAVRCWQMGCGGAENARDAVVNIAGTGRRGASRTRVASAGRRLSAEQRQAGTAALAECAPTRRWGSICQTSPASR